jgi:hypothetical protein
MAQKPVKVGPRAASGERNDRLDAFIDAVGNALGSHSPACNKAGN